jgi:outer membrane protein W
MSSIACLLAYMLSISQYAYAQEQINDKTFRFTISSQYVMPAGYYEDLVASGYGFTVQAIVEDSITQNFFVGLDMQYIYFEGKTHVTDHARFLPLSLIAGYCFTTWKLNTIPYLGFGASYNTLYKYRDTTYTEYEKESQLRPLSKVGIQVECLYNNMLSLLIGTEYGTIFEKENRIIYLSYHAGISLRF